MTWKALQTKRRNLKSKDCPNTSTNLEEGELGERKDTTLQPDPVEDRNHDQPSELGD